MAGQWLPPDHSMGDANTIGGYMRVHARPAAFEGSDGLSYSVALEVDETGDGDRPFAAFFLFLRWRRMGAQGIDGHLESDYLGWGDTAAAARDALGAWPLAEVRARLEERLAELSQQVTSRRWYDVMRDDDA
jgi:hypothetical protein